MALNNKNVTYSSHPSRAARAAHARGDKEFRTYDTSAIVPKRSPVPGIIVAVVALIAIVAIVFFAVRGCAADTELLPAGQQVNVTIEEGESAQAIGDTLVADHLIASSQDFVNEVTRLEAAAALIPGTYTFEGGQSVEDIVRLIMAGPASTGVNVTVPEGLTRAETAKTVAQATNGRITEEDFMAASENASVYAADYPFLETAGENSLEGFLFPKTYPVTASDDAAAVVRMMLNQFGEETKDLSFAYPEKKGLNLYQAVNLASIVEKESNDDEEVRAHVAGVFYNRLASDRPYLESDATTAYEVGREPTADEVHADTPYGTYANPGLPPTPICSPGLSSLKAVCEPMKTKDMFFYFHTADDGTVESFFSQTLEEHEQAIADHS